MCHSSALSWVVGRETRCLLEPNPDQRGSGGGGGKYFGEEVEQKGTAGTGAGAGAGVGCVVCGIAPMRAGKDTPVAHRRPLLRIPQGGGGGGGGWSLGRIETLARGCSSGVLTAVSVRFG
jgi:hypothetical protein